MAKKTSTVKIGIFIFLGLAILVTAIFLIGDKRSLFSSTFNVVAYFNDIQGLRSGASVRLSGIDVGSVSEVEIVGDQVGRVKVTMDLDEDIRRFIRTDTEASIETEGLVGNKVVVLQIKNAAGEPIGDFGTIQGKEPLGLSAIIAETQGIMEYTKEMTKDLSEIVGKVNKGEGSIGKLLNDDMLYNNAADLTKRADESLEAITAELEDVSSLFTQLGTGVERVIGNVDSVVTDVDSLIAGISKGRGLLGSLLVEGGEYDTTFKSVLKNVEITTESARLAASRLAENMEALKHNWLFKSYFEQRGYWEQADYEDEIDAKLIELNEKIDLLDKRIETLKTLEAAAK